MLLTATATDKQTNNGESVTSLLAKASVHDNI